MKLKGIIFSGLAAILSCLTCNSIAQSEWIGVLPMQYNASFAGSAGGPRVVAQQYYSNIAGNRGMGSTALSADHFISKISTGIGVTYQHFEWNKSVSNMSANYNPDCFKAGLNVSPKISVKGKYTLSPSVGIFYTNMKSSSWYPASFQIRYNKEYLSYRTGIMFNTNKYYISLETGFNPKQYPGMVSPVITAGYTLQGKPESGFSLTPQILYIRQPYKMETVPLGTHSSSSYSYFYYNRFDLNLTFRFGKFITGPGYNIMWEKTGNRLKALTPSGGQILGLMVGFQSRKCKLVYVQHMSEALYSAELSFRYSFGSKGGGKAGAPANVKI